MTSSTKLTFKSRPWHVPSEGTAFGGWLEGCPSEAERQEILARARAERASWKPDAQAWDQLIQLQRFVGKQVRIQFWDDGSMWLLNEEEWPHPVSGECQGIVTLIDDGRPQAYILLRRPIDTRTGKPSESSYLTGSSAINCTLAPVAEIHEIETIGGRL